MRCFPPPHETIWRSRVSEERYVWLIAFDRFLSIRASSPYAAQPRKMPDDNGNMIFTDNERAECRRTPLLGY